MNNKKALIILTLGCDDICKPCKYLKNGKCTDIVKNNEVYNSKEEWNMMIDRRLFNQLGLKEGQKITALEFCYVLQEKLKNISKIWKDEPCKKTIIREKNLFKGIVKYIEKNPKSI